MDQASRVWDFGGIGLRDIGVGFQFAGFRLCVGCRDARLRQSNVGPGEVMGLGVEASSGESSYHLTG